MIRFRWRRLLSRLHRARVVVASRGWQALKGRLSSRNEAEPGEAPPRPGSAVQAVQTDNAAAPRILVIDGALPRPDRDSGSLRLVNVMGLLRRAGFGIDFLAEDGCASRAESRLLRDLGIHVLGPEHAAMPFDWIARSPPYAAAVVSRYHLASYWFPLLRQTSRGTRLILDTVDLHFLREQREAELRHNTALARAAGATRRLELAQIQAADVTWVVSDVEKQLLGKLLPQASVEIVSNIHQPIAHGAGFSARAGLLFVGGGRHPPNADAVRWLVAELFPRICEQSGEACELHLVGMGLADTIADLSCHRQVRVHGHVPDLGPLLTQCRIGLAPLRFGAGVKGKINQYMAHGLPTVATSCAAEAMHLVDGEDVLLADTADDFATAVLRLNADAVLWERISRNGTASVDRHFSEAAMVPAILRTLSGLSRRTAAAGDSSHQRLQE